MCIRRPTLDLILAEHAAEQGADLRLGTKVTDVVRDDAGRVAGVRVEHGGQTTDLGARLVVGADGRGSAIAKAVDARRYHATPSERIFLWTYYEGVDVDDEPTFHFYRTGDDGFLASPVDAGAFIVALGVSLHRWPEFADDPSRRFEQVVRTVPRLAELVEGASRIDRMHIMRRYDGFFRESAGPGWVLVGDAGHFKDPTPGQGISDALRQGERLSREIVAGLRAGDAELDRRTAEWWAWRDEDALEKYWFAWDLGRRGEVAPVVQELLNIVVADDRARTQLLDVFAHRTPPSKAFTRTRFLRAAARLLRRGSIPRRAVLAEVRDTVRTDIQRRRLAKNPVYESPEVDDREPASPEPQPA
jgi:menaquinone-9 beta-reductase